MGLSGDAPSARDDDDERLVPRLRGGDEAAFVTLVGRYHRVVVRLAGAYVKTSAAAEDAAQETWMGVLQGIAGFEGKAPLRAWIFRIAANVAKKRALREARGVPLSALDGDDDGPAVDASRFQEEGARWAGHWASPPEPWSDAERRMLAGETASLVARAIDSLPGAQRQVITLRDVQELDAAEVCEVLGISEGNQRVLLHRARSKVRAELEAHVAEGRR